MCHWDTYTYDCGCLELRLRERCANKMALDGGKDYFVTKGCRWMQRVSADWRFHQDRICALCSEKEKQMQEAMQDNTVIIRRVGCLPWSVIESAAHAEAVVLGQDDKHEFD